MLTIAVLQQKGGCGKTTLATNLAAAAHLGGVRTLLVDMDRQGSAFDWSVARAEGSKLDGLTVVRADRPLALRQLDNLTAGYDCVVIDGPPRLDEISRRAAVAADVALLPVQPGPFDFWAVAETVEALDAADLVRAELGRAAIRRAFVLNRAPRGTRLARDAESQLLAYGQFVGVVYQRVAFPDAASRGESVFTAPGAKLAATDVERLWRALQALNGAQSKKTKSHGTGGCETDSGRGKGQPRRKTDRG